MISEESKAVAEKARGIYESQLRKELEAKYSGRYVCIEPVSGSFFLERRLTMLSMRQSTHFQNG